MSTARPGVLADPVRVLLLTTSFPLDPASASGIFVERLVRGLPADVRAHVLAPAGPGPVADRALPHGGLLSAVRYAPRRWHLLAHAPGGIPVALRRQPWLWLLVPALVFALFLACLRHVGRADVVHGNWTLCGLVGGLAARLRGRPAVTTLRGEDITRMRSSPAHRWALRACAALNDRLVVVSPHMAELLRECLPPSALARVAHIPNGVEQELLELPLRHATGPEAARRILSVGALIPRKNMALLVEALALGPSNQDQVVLVGEGSERERLVALAGQLGVAGRVHLAGAVAPAAMRDVYAGAHAYVLASESEGRSNALIEAMAAGIPVVAADIPGVGDVVRHGRTGLLFAPGDAQDLARRLDELRRSPALAAQLAGAARQWVRDEGLTWAAAGQRYARLYREVIARSGPGEAR